MKIVYDLKTRRAEPGNLTGVLGQISFERMVEQLRRAGEFKPDEDVTHLCIDPIHGLIQYRVERK